MSAYSSSVLSDSPSLYWRLGESAGTTAADASGNARTGTYTGSFTLGASGALTAISDTDTAVDLTGLGGRVTSGYNPFTNGTTRTFEGWAYRNTNASDDVLLGSSAAYPNAVILQVQAGSNAVLFFTAAGGYSMGSVPGTAQWFHWALVFNETANTAELYVNGISQGVVAQPDPYNAAPGNVQIGAYGAGSSPFDGKLDEFAVYESGLSAARIAAHYAAGLAAIASPQDFTPEQALNIAVTTAEGVEYRWGPDEPEAAYVPQSISFGTAIPGGFTTATITLSRRIDQDFPDLNLFDDVVIYGPGAETAWEGRVAQLPRSHGDDFSIQVGCVGHAAHLKDDPSFREVYVDTDLTAWEGPSVQRRINVNATSTVNDHSVQADDTGAPALVTKAVSPWAAVTPPLCEPIYRSPVALASVYYAWKKGANVNSADANWSWIVLLATDDTLTTNTATANLRAAGPGSGTLADSNGNRKVAALQFAYAAVAVATDGVEYPIFWTRPVVYGNHGLTKQGTEDATTSKGFFASDVIADVVSRAAPLLNYTLGGSIQATTFVIPQLAFKDPVTAEDAIMATNAYHLWEWGVYDDKTFFYRAPNPDRLTWEVRLSDGAQLDLEGDAGDAVYNGVYVRYTDPVGVAKTVGPPGSGADATDTSLYDTSASNPVNAHGISKRWAILDISQTTTPAGAIQLGAIWLAEQALPQRRGQVVITGTAKHPTAGNLPAWKIRAGDYITIADHSANVARRVIDTSYSGNSVTCSLDNHSFKLEAILDRLNFSVRGIS